MRIFAFPAAEPFHFNLSGASQLESPLSAAFYPLKYHSVRIFQCVDEEEEKAQKMR